MHSKYAKDGLAAVSVSLDKPADQARPLKFLKSVNATFTNLLLDEDDEAWQKAFDIGGPPVIFVYDRQGKQVKKADSYEGVEQLVVDLLKKPKGAVENQGAP